MIHSVKRISVNETQRIASERTFCWWGNGSRARNATNVELAAGRIVRGKELIYFGVGNALFLRQGGSSSEDRQANKGTQTSGDRRYTHV